jgi:hypothetical protein
MRKRIVLFGICFVFASMSVAADFELLVSAGPSYFIALSDGKSTELSTYGLNVQACTFFYDFPVGVYSNVTGYASGAKMVTLGPVYQCHLNETLRVIGGIGVNVSQADRAYLDERGITFPEDEGWGIGASIALYLRFTDQFFSEFGAAAEYSFSGHTGPNIRPFVAIGWRRELQ